jgi:phosphoribosylamine--glycine ligase
MRMKVLLVGGGGREHALAWKLARSPRLERLFVAPGNGGIDPPAETVPIAADDVAAITAFAERERIDLTVVGPELPLTLGLVDELAARGLRAFGPTRAAAQLEGSKAFAKELLREAGVATADFAVFTDAAAALRHVRSAGAPIVVKADGLAAGKGVTVCTTLDQAERAIEDALARRVFGSAGARIIVEEHLEGEEASFLALTDGQHVVPLATSQDHKRIGDGDTGPNTGGMGAYSPAPVVTPALERAVVDEILKPTVAALARRGIVYRGVLYAGLMIDRGRARVIEFNVRFGDPECQVLMARLETDLIELCEATIDGRLDRVQIAWDRRHAACVVLAAPGYPGKVDLGGVIRGADAAARAPDVLVFHAGTRRREDGELVTSGGRVLGVTGLGGTIESALSHAYAAVEQIQFPGMQYRRDIGRRAIGRGAEP